MVSIAASADPPNATAMKRIVIALIAARAFIGEGMVVAELSDAVVFTTLLSVVVFVTVEGEEDVGFTACVSVTVLVAVENDEVVLEVSKAAMRDGKYAGNSE